MNKDAESNVSKWDKACRTKSRRALTFITNNSSQSRVLEEFYEKFAAFAPGIRYDKSKESDAEEPFLRVGKNIIFKAVPNNKLLDTFLTLLTPDLCDVPKSVVNYLQGFETPVTLKIFVTPFCPFCPKVVSDVARLSLANKNIEVIIIDGSLFPELARENNVVSAPTVLFNEHFRWEGQINPADIAEVIGNSKPEELSMEALRAIVESGKAVLLSELMIKSGSIFPAFYELITHEKWPVRLGALVALEEIAGNNRTLSEKAFTFLWKNFDSYSSSVQGDIIYITGEAGDKSNLVRIEKVLSGDFNSDLKEAANDAFETLNLLN